MTPMSLAIENLIRVARRRLLLAYLSREGAWRVLAITLALFISKWGGPLRIMPWLVAIGVAIHWIIRWHSPSGLAAAIEVDRQFSLQELISSGLATSDTSGMGAATRSQAERAAETIDPGLLNLGRLGLRYWIAALLLLGIVLAMPGSPLAPAERTGTTSEPATANDDQDRRARAPVIPPIGSAVRSAHHPAGAAAADFVQSDDQSDDFTPGRAGGQRPRAQADSRSAGGGLATGGRTGPRPPNPSSAITASADNATGEKPSASAGQSSSNDGKVAGSGILSRDPPPHSTGVDTSENSSPEVAPGSPASPAARIVPPRYREIVREYFAR